MSQSRGLKAACFDLDGTLIDTGPLHVRSERLALKSLGVDEFSPDHPVTFGAGILPGMQMLADHYGFPSAEYVLEAYLPAWETSFATGLEAMPGADAALRLIHGFEVPLALVTSGENEYVDGVLAQFGWEDLFAHRVTEESVTNLKPHPEAYLTAAQLLELSPDQCAGVEDSASGMRALDAAGLFSVLVQQDEFLRSVTPAGDVTLHSLSQLDRELASKLFDL